VKAFKLFDARKLMQQRNDDITRVFMKQLARLGFGSVLQDGRQDRWHSSLT